MADPNTYFLPGYGISRSVIQSEIRYFCGPDAIVRPFTHKQQIQDLKIASKVFEERQA
ncbi:hypothetical protein NA57DRAFT_26852, partial [Rhizodiscina lignyota]